MNGWDLHKLMKDDVKISVIMGIFNPKDRDQLFQAVMSIVEQTFQDWEMILYDDGSEERYAEIIRAAATLDSRIHYLRGTDNRGLAYALNRCIEAARGKYIARMDADDVSKPERLEILYEMLEAHPEYQWVGSNSELIDDNGTWGVHRVQEIPRSEDFLAYSPYIHPTVVFRKAVLVECNGYTVAPETRRCEDYDLFMRLHKAGYQGYNVQQMLLQYREDQDAYRRRKYRYCIQESRIRYRGFRNLGILQPRTLPYVFKPLVVGLLSPRMVRYIKRNIKKEYHVELPGSSQT